MKKLLLPLLLAFTVCSFAQNMNRTIRLFAVDRDNQRLLLKNWSDTGSVDASNYRLGAKGDSTADLTSVSTPLFGNYLIPKNSVLILQMNSGFFLDAVSDLSLHLPATAGRMGDTATLLDFVQWQNDSNGGFEDQAVLKGFWTKNDYISTPPPYLYNGNHYQRGLAFWQTFVLPAVNIRLCYVKPGSDIFAIKNYGPSNYDISTLKVCSKMNCQSLNSPPIQIIKGDTNLAVGDTAVFKGFPLDDVEGDLSLFLPSNVQDTASMLDFVQWGDSLQGFEDTAIVKGIWGHNEFLPIGPTDSIVFFGDETRSNRGFNKWITNYGETVYATDVRLLWVRPGTDNIALKNFGSAPYNTVHLQLCSNNICIDSIGNPAMQVVRGNKTLSPGDTVVLNGLNLDNISGDVSLFFAGIPHTSTSIVDFVQWGDDPNGFSGLAQTAGIWGPNQFLKTTHTTDSLIYFGDLTNRGFAKWRTDSLSHIGIKTIGNDFRGLSIYPNPANETLNISFSAENTGKVLMRIMSLSGQEVYRHEQNMTVGSFELQADIKNLPAGVYSISLQSGSSMVNSKLLKF